MDAHALLTSQGWRGTGNSLHPTNNSIGLSKPLLVSQKQNNLGLGKKQHKTSDMWWMNAFDSSLKGLDTSKQGQVVQTVTSSGLDMVAKGGAKWVGSKGGLYASFVRGECLSGTLTPESNEESEESPRKKRRRYEDVKESKEERRARKASKRASREKELRAAEGREDSSEKSETKEERRARKAAKRALKAQGAVEDGSDMVEVEDQSVKEPETKEQRKERKQLKKLLREADQKDSESETEKAKKKKRRKE
jgi:nucleolar protein TMA23